MNKPFKLYTGLMVVFLLLLTDKSIAQEDAILLVISNHESKILLDGVEKGTVKANAAFRITTTIGEHYVEAERLGSGISQNKGEIVQLEAGKQKIIKLEFADLTLTAYGNAIPVAELNFALPGLVEVTAWDSENPDEPYPYPEYYYAFEKGDEIILDITMSNKKGTNAIHVSTYPDGVERYTNQAFTELTDLRIKVPERSIYRLAFTTNHAFARNAFLKVARKPASSETLNFNTKVTYKRTLTPVSVLEPQSFFVNSGSNATFLGGKSKITVPVNLPANTVEWFYRFSASREAGDIENVKNNFGLLGEVTKLLFNLTGVGAAINTLAVDKLTQPPGANYCDIYFLEHQYIGLFEAKADDQWRYFTEGSRQNFKAGNVKVTCCNSGSYYLGIKNPDATFGINVLVEVVALLGSDGYVMDSK
jgi:hypothetical protein